MDTILLQAVEGEYAVHGKKTGLQFLRKEPVGLVELIDIRATLLADGISRAKGFGTDVVRADEVGIEISDEFRMELRRLLLENVLHRDAGHIIISAR